MTVHELPTAVREAAISAFTSAHGAAPDFGFAPDRAWIEGYAHLRPVGEPAPVQGEPEPTRDDAELASDFEHRLNAWHREQRATPKEAGSQPTMVLHYSFVCFSCAHEWEVAGLSDSDCPKCGTTNRYCAKNPEPAHKEAGSQTTGRILYRHDESANERAIRQSVEMIDGLHSDDYRVKAIRRVLCGAILIAEDGQPTAAGAVPTDDAIRDVLAERARQDAQWGGPAHDDRHSSVEFLTFIDKQVTVALNEYCARDRERLVKIAALAVAAVESLDRKTALAAPADGKGASNV